MNITLRADEQAAYMTLPTTAEAASVRSAIPGASWDGTARRWVIPVTRRSCMRLREFVTGHSVDIDANTVRILATAADSTPSPDITVEKDRICIRFEFHKSYQDFVQSLSASKRTDGTWTLPLSSAADMVSRLNSMGLDLIVAPEVKELVRPQPFKAFTGSLYSLNDVPVKELQYVIEKKAPSKKVKSLAERLESLGINSALDALMCFPLRYLDRTSPTGVLNLVEGEEGVVLGTIAVVNADPRRQLLKIVVEDDDKHRVTVPLFRQMWLAKRYHVGQRVIVSGKYNPWKPSSDRIVPQITDGRIDPMDLTTGQTPIIPIYPQSPTNKVTTWDLSAMTRETLARIDAFGETLPENLRQYRHLESLDFSLRNIHYPETMGARERAMDRLIYEELLALQIYIQSSKTEYENATGISQQRVAGGLYETFLGGLPYALTGAQKRVLGEISQDLAAEKPMHRLLQGDVSSGKTTIAHALMFATVDSGHQGVILAPTEILAEQLYSSLAATAGDSMSVEFLGNKTKIKDRRRIIAGLADGSVNVVVGTHAILVDDVQFADLGTVVIDEQHRFGTAQRSLLRSRRSDGRTPDMLVMTATPIPRTASMVVYGDMDLSILDELPPGRVPISTQWINEDATEVLVDYMNPAWEDIRQNVAAGRQAYVVASLVEDNDKIAAASTTAAFDTLSSGVLSNLRLGLVHGQMPRTEREETMAKFAAGEIDVLVSTTVIEVGVNVPNATVMVVLDAGRFGIAQLHQIRGRVGRASYKSTCYLVGSVKTEDGRERLNALVSSTDGFYLAEKDLEIRGEGALFGTRQSGVSDLRLASLRRDLAILEMAKEDAARILSRSDEFATLINQITSSYVDKEIHS